MTRAIFGPTFEEMLHPSAIDPAIRRHAVNALTESPLDPINLYNLTWRGADDKIKYEVLPAELTGVDAPIVVLYGRDFPTGSHKVGAAYSVLAEALLFGQVDIDQHTVVWPSTGNYGIGGAWVGGRVGARSIVVLPEGMSRERFERIETYGAQVIKTPGVESNVKEIYDKTWELRHDPNIRILNQFEVMGNYRFHYHVTGNTIVELAAELKQQGLGDGSIAAFCSAMGSAGTIAAGDRLKQVWPDLRIVGLEPIQCPTLYNNGYGGHDIQGIGDKHVTWIHNVLNMDAIICLDDIECKKGLQLLTSKAGQETLMRRYSVAEAKTRQLASIFGISGVCNALGAIKTAKHYQFGKRDVIVTICTDAIDRYHSVMEEMENVYGEIDDTRAVGYLEAIFHGAKTDWIKDGTPDMRRQWHNLKYFSWVEQQRKTVEELDAQKEPEWWVKHQRLIPEMDARIKAARADLSIDEIPLHRRGAENAEESQRGGGEMNNVTGFKCVECARSFSVSEIEYICPACGGNLDALYDYERIGKQMSKASLAADRNLTIWRYRPLLPIEDSSPAPPLTVGWTPIYDCPRLAAEFGVKQLFVKDDGRNPTASFKDRPSALAVVKAREAGARVITTASSGNAGSALSGMCASVGMASVIFVPTYAPQAKIAQLQIYGSNVVLVEGSYDEAFDLCLEAGRRYGWYQRSTGYNPFMTEGKKTAALEIGEQLNWEVPDKIFVGVGDGNIIGGLWKGFNDLHRLGLIDRLPQMFGVQAEGASAVVDAANGDGVVRVGPSHTIADSINVGHPRDSTRAIRAIRDSGGRGVKVSDEEIIAAIGRLARRVGVFVEPAGAAAFAGFVKQCENGAVKPDERALLMLTGNGLKDVEAARSASCEPFYIKPDIAELDRIPNWFGSG